MSRTRELLAKHPMFAIENVPLAPLRRDLVLTGPMFGLNRIVRKRIFELSWFVLQPPVINNVPKHIPMHQRCTITQTLRFPRMYYARRGAGLQPALPVDEACKVMGIDIPMTACEVGEAIPPAYSKFIAEQAISAIGLKR